MIFSGGGFARVDARAGRVLDPLTFFDVPGRARPLGRAASSRRDPGGPGGPALPDLCLFAGTYLPMAPGGGPCIRANASISIDPLTQESHETRKERKRRPEQSEWGRPCVGSSRKVRKIKWRDSTQGAMPQNRPPALANRCAACDLCVARPLSSGRFGKCRCVCPAGGA